MRRLEEEAMASTRRTKNGAGGRGGVEVDRQG